MNPHRAYTLVETVVVVGISAVLMIALGFLIFNFGTTYNYEQGAALSARSNSMILREVESLVTPADQVLSSHTFTSGSYSSGASTLVLEIPSIDISGNVISNTYDYAVFYISGTNVYRLLESDALSHRTSGTKLLSTTISSLTFSYNSVDYASVTAVTADVQTQTHYKQATASDHQHETIRLRNR